MHWFFWHYSLESQRVSFFLGSVLRQRIWCSAPCAYYYVFY